MGTSMDAGWILPFRNPYLISTSYTNTNAALAQWANKPSTTITYTYFFYGLIFLEQMQQSRHHNLLKWLRNSIDVVVLCVTYMIYMACNILEENNVIVTYFFVSY